MSKPKKSGPQVRTNFIGKLYKINPVYCLYFVILVLFSIYSYTQIDLNLTLFNHPWWNNFRSFVIQIGYFQRNLSVAIYLFFIAALFVLQFFALKKKLSGLKLAVVIGGICLFSYPFLSHDFFNYIFDARILTFYGKNPYFYKALDFPADPFIRFMQWTHRTYPYGPVFLLVTAIPSFLSFGKFILNYFLFKAMFVFFYLLMVYFTDKINKKWALILAVNPLIIVEGLMSSHNDLVALSLSLIGVYFIFREKNLPARLFLVLSGGIKYASLPLIVLSKKYKLFNYVALLGIVAGFIYLIKMEIQPWYFLMLFSFIPFMENLVVGLNIFFAGLLFSYYPYVAYGGWDKPYKVAVKHDIIIAFAVLNLVYFGFLKLLKPKKTD